MKKPESAAQSYTKRMQGYIAEGKVCPAERGPFRSLEVKPHPEQARMDAYLAIPSLWDKA